jgi:hypothetical protein
MITHVAICFQGKVYSLPAPNRHHNVIRLIVEQTGTKTVDAHGDDQGFLANDGLYWRRDDALRIARESGQLKPGCMGEKLGELYSEDVW